MKKFLAVIFVLTGLFALVGFKDAFAAGNLGDTCNVTQPCDTAAGLICNGITCIPLELGKVGEGCRATNPRCDGELLCSTGGVCYSPGGLGGACAPSANGSCSSGLNICVNNSGLCCVTQDQCPRVDGHNVGDPCGGNTNCGSSMNCINNKCQLITNNQINDGPSAINGSCGIDYIDTAIGCIPYNNQNALIGFFLKWGLGIGGGIAFILILVAGFQIMSSRGDPTRLKAGQELMTSAIAGLLLLIFSLVILRIIGYDILKIPQFL